MAATKPTFAQLLAKTRRLLQDETKTYWTDDELTDYLNEGQYEFVRETQVLRAQVPITRRENLDVYPFPEDMLEVVRLEREDGNEVTAITATKLQQFTGNKFREEQGPAQHYYSDLDGEESFRFWPTPRPPIEDAGKEFQNHLFQHTDLEIDEDVLALEKFRDKMLVLSKEKVYIVDESGRLESSISHSLSLTSGSNLRVVFPVGVAPFMLTFKTSTISKIEFDGTISTFGTSGSVIETLLPPRIHETPVIAYMIAGGSMKQSVLTAFSEAGTVSGLSTVRQAINDGKDTGNTLYLALSGSSDGFVSVPNDSTPATSTVTTIDSSDSAFGVALDPKLGTIYYIIGNGVVDQAELKTTASAGDRVSGVRFVDDGAEVGSGMYISNDAIYAKDDSDNLVRLDISTLAKTNTASDQTYALDIDLTLDNGLDHNGALYLHHETVTDISKDIFYNDNEVGFLINVDDTLFLSEFGIIVDILDDGTGTDNADVNIFTTEEGMVVAVVDSEDHGHIFYIRCPIEGKVEINEPDVLPYFAAARAYEKDNDQINLAKSDRWFARFENIVNRQRRKNMKSFNNAHTGNRTYYF